jgi:hypothetical protein
VTPDDASEDTKVSNGISGKAHDVNMFVEDAAALRITPFMLDTFAREYAEMVRARDATATELDDLRTSNRSLSSQVSVQACATGDEGGADGRAGRRWRPAWRP